MKAFITLFAIILLAPAIRLQAQANSNYNHHSSYPQYYYVRTVSNHGIIPTTSIQIIDKDGRSISCKSDDLKSKNTSRQLCKTDSLINALETCADCKIVKTKAQMDTLYMLLAKITPAHPENCIPRYGGAAYAMYMRYGEGLLQLNKKIAKGCGISDSLNKLIDDFIREFEKPGDKDLLKEQNKTLAEKVNKPISDFSDKNFETSTAPNDTFNTMGISAYINIDGILRLRSKVSLTSIEIKFRSPTVQKSVGKGYVTKRKPTFSRTYQLRKKTGSDLYDIDITMEKYKQMGALEIIPLIATGSKTKIIVLNQYVQKVPEKIEYPFKLKKSTNKIL